MSLGFLRDATISDHQVSVMLSTFINNVVQHTFADPEIRSAIFFSISPKRVALSNQQRPSVFDCTYQFIATAHNVSILDYVPHQEQTSMSRRFIQFHLFTIFLRNTTHIIIQYAQDNAKFYEHFNMCKSISPFECTLPAAFSWAHTHTHTHSLTSVHFNYKATRLLNRR